MDLPQPSLHRTILLSLPGAALNSLPIGLWMYRQWSPHLSLWPTVPGSMVRWLLMILAPTALITSSLAIWRFTREIDRMKLRMILVLLNFIALLGALGTLLYISLAEYFG